MARRSRLALLLATILTACSTAASSLISQNLVVAVLGLSSALALSFLYMSLSRSPRGVNINLTYVSATLHMYSIATGEAGPKDLVGAISETEQYGVLSSIFRRIKVLAEKFGYGFTGAASAVAQATKPPLKDFLMRCTEIFASRRPRDYLEIEVSTAIEEYSGMYSRALDNIRLMGGIFITFQSTIIFVIMSLSILTVLMAETGVVYVSYAISILSITMLYIGFRKMAPKDPFFYKGKETPRSYRMFAHALAALPAFAFPAAVLYFVAGPPIAFAVLGAGLLIPGIFAYSLERFVNSMESHYPTFIKAVSEHLISVSDLKSVLSYVLYMELGPLKRLVNRALNRLKLGISAEETIDFLSSETGSHSIYITNRIFLDAFRRGGDVADVGKKLSGFVVRVLELRKKRLSMAKSFEVMVMVMQPLVVILIVLLTNVLGFFSTSIANIPFFTFGEVPLEFMSAANALMVLILAFLNSLSISDARGGYWGASLLYAGILLFMSAASWYFTDQFITAYFSRLSIDILEAMI